MRKIMLEERIERERVSKTERERERITKQDKFPSQLISNQTMARINWLLEAQQSVKIKCSQLITSIVPR